MSSATASSKSSSTIPKRKPVFVKVDQLKPGTSGHTLIVKVVSSMPVTSPKPRQKLIAECLVGDESGFKLIALKKAYAEIILNTAKEAAARVMVAEKKAVRYQRELSDVKEDALQMMLRLKQMMESKIHEADVAASRQQSKIDELEAQLHEAEDIVKDLREELAIVRDELDYMRKNQPQRMSKQLANHAVSRGQEAQVDDFAPSISGFDHNQVLKVQAIHVAESEIGNLIDQRINGSVTDGQPETLKVSNFEVSPNLTLAKELQSLSNESSQRNHQLANENFSNEDCLRGKIQILKDDSTARNDCENSGKSVTQISSAEV